MRRPLAAMRRTCRTLQPGRAPRRVPGTCGRTPAGRDPRPSVPIPSWRRSRGEQVVRRHEADIRMRRGVIQKAKHHAFHRVVDFPIVRREAEVAAGGSSLFETGDEFVKACSRYKTVAAE